jgi:hypothetical protein
MKRYAAILTLTTATHVLAGFMLAVAGLLTIQNQSSWIVIHTPIDAIAVTYTVSRLILCFLGQGKCVIYPLEFAVLSTPMPEI